MAVERRDQWGAQYLSRAEFEQAMLRVDGRLNQQDGELTKIRERIHTIANAVAKIQYIEMTIDKLSESVEKGFANLAKAQEQKDTASNRRLMAAIAIISLVFTAISVSVAVLAKVLG